MDEYQRGFKEALESNAVRGMARGVKEAIAYIDGDDPVLEAKLVEYLTSFNEIRKAIRLRERWERPIITGAKEGR